MKIKLIGQIKKSSEKIIRRWSICQTISETSPMNIIYQKPVEHIKTGSPEEIDWNLFIKKVRDSLSVSNYQLIEDVYDDSFNLISNEVIAEYRGDIENA